jgi:uncharacterized protein (DUF488 family)
MSQPLIYTIGHSNHPIDAFLSLLKQHQVEYLVDVRTSPYSRFSPHFRKSALEAHLRNAGIEYVYLGDELGGRPGESRDFKPDDLVDYEHIAAQPWYEAGLQELLEIAGKRRTAIMCSEENPQYCHRNLLIADSLLQRSLATVQHIRGDGELEPAQLKPKQTRLL